MVRHEWGWESTGHTERVDLGERHHRMPPFDPRSGEHLWVITPVFKADPKRWVADPATLPLLDQENLIYMSPVFCFHCEQPYTDRLGRRRCAGGPS